MALFNQIMQYHKFWNNQENFSQVKKMSAQGKHREALDILSSFPEQFLTSEICVFRAFLMLMTDNEFSFKNIEHNFFQALAINPNSADAHYELGMFYDAVMGESQKGIKYLKMVRQILEQQLREVEQGMIECVEFDVERDFLFTSDFQKMKQKQFSRQDFCCDSLFTNLLKNEVAVVYISKFREYGIKILDGRTSIQTIDYCPWCGIKLPESLRDKWFDMLRSMGYENPLDDDIPKQYCTDKWWKDKYYSKGDAIKLKDE